MSLESALCDQLVTNLVLPDADAYALLRAIRRLPGPGSQLKAVALCADTEPQETKLHAIMEGFHLVITRPCSPDHLAVALRGMARLDALHPAAEPRTRDDNSAAV
jgi:CheY-like chemotaxis protein